MSFIQSVMHSQARLTYNQVNDYFSEVQRETPKAEVPVTITGNKAVKNRLMCCMICTKCYWSKTRNSAMRWNLKPRDLYQV